MKWIVRLLLLCAVVWSCRQFGTVVGAVSTHELLDSRVNQQELSLIVHTFLILLVLLLGIVTLQEMVQQGKLVGGLQSASNLIRRKEVLIATILAVLPRSTETAASEVRSTAVMPIRAVGDPVLAVVLLNQVLQRRRREMQQRIVPGHLSLESKQRLYELRLCAQRATNHPQLHATIDDEGLKKHFNELFIEEPAGPPTHVAPSWDVVIRVYGYPTVENRSGECAQFGKRRSLEVLSWLSMNKDRPRRSAVRTAVWDVEITDATFSTILSDVRRGLSDVVTHRARSEFLPPTFTDVIELGVSLTTDFDLLNNALQTFRLDESSAVLLADELEKIRDIPFAGANYMWADLDGTTTRMVVTALQASVELATWAKENGNVSMFLGAIKAGLRVLPGCEELLTIQQSFISDQSMSRPTHFGG